MFIASPQLYGHSRQPRGPKTCDDSREPNVTRWRWYCDRFADSRPCCSFATIYRRESHTTTLIASAVTRPVSVARRHHPVIELTHLGHDTCGTSPPFVARRNDIGEYQIQKGRPVGGTWRANRKLLCRLRRQSGAPLLQMWQQLDCDVAKTSPHNPSGCEADHLPRVGERPEKSSPTWARTVSAARL